MTVRSVKDIKYKNNLIKDVILRVDFANSVKAFEENIPKDLFNEIKKIYPITEIRDNVLNHVVLEKKEVKKSKEIIKEFIFSDNNDKVVINKNVFLISIKKYDTFEKLNNDFKSIWSFITKYVTGDYIKRLGLRYINNLDFENLEFKISDLISKTLNPIDLKATFDFSPIKIGNTIEILIDDSRLRFNFGLGNPDYPSKMIKKIFVLDFDCYFEGLLDIEEVEKRILKYHFYIQDLFEKSITQKCKDFLNEK